METKFNFNLIDLYKYSFIDRIFIRLHTRALGGKIERLFVLLPVLINSNLCDKSKAVESTKIFLLETIQPKNLALKIYDRVILRLFDYKKDSHFYIQDRQKSLDIFCQNIQLYTLIDRIMSDEEQKNLLKSIIKKQYDEAYFIDDNTKNLLKFQEQHYL